MKKNFLTIAALLFALALAACSGNGSSDDPKHSRDGSDPGTVSDTLQGGGAETRDVAELSLEAILRYAETGATEYFRPRVLSPAEQAVLRAEVEKQGGKITFDADGTINITGSDTSRLTLHPDGSFDGVDADGNPFGFTNKKEWPESVFGSAVPKADFEIRMQVEDDESLMIMFDNVTFDQAKAYGEKLASAGFAADREVIEMKENGIYSFSASNADHLSVEFSYMESGGSVTCALTVGR